MLFFKRKMALKDVFIFGNSIGFKATIFEMGCIKTSVVEMPKSKFLAKLNGRVHSIKKCGERMSGKEVIKGKDKFGSIIQFNDDATVKYAYFNNGARFLYFSKTLLSYVNWTRKDVFCVSTNNTMNCIAVEQYLHKDKDTIIFQKTEIPINFKPFVEKIHNSENASSIIDIAIGLCKVFGLDDISSSSDFASYINAR